MAQRVDWDALPMPTHGRPMNCREIAEWVREQTGLPCTYQAIQQAERNGMARLAEIAARCGYNLELVEPEAEPDREPWSDLVKSTSYRSRW